MLVVVSHVLLVLASDAVCLAYRWRIVSQIRITVITIVFWHFCLELFYECFFFLFFSFFCIWNDDDDDDDELLRIFSQ